MVLRQKLVFPWKCFCQEIKENRIQMSVIEFRNICMPVRSLMELFEDVKIIIEGMGCHDH